MPRARAVSCARVRSREAIPVTSLHSPCCMAGITRLTAMRAVESTPQRTFFIDSELYREGGVALAGRSREHTVGQTWCQTAGFRQTAPETHVRHHVCRVSDPCAGWERRWWIDAP